jgi:hypothetical protein
MRPIAEVLSLPLSFTQPRAMERSYELRAGGELVATLEFQSAFGSLAVAKAAEGSFTFKRVGFFSPQATARREGSESDLAVYTPRWTGRDGELALAGGERLHFGPANFWGTRFSFGDAEGRTVTTFGPEPDVHRFSDLFRTQALVTVDPAASARPDLALLVLFGWYLVILRHQDASAAAAAAG